jgi:hypothetical protein
MTLPNNQLATNLEELANLYNLQAVLNNLLTNLELIEQGGTGQIITINNANLFVLAALYYGDATRWTTIAQANGLKDPMTYGIRMLTIPQTSQESGGILIGQVNA